MFLGYAENEGKNRDKLEIVRDMLVAALGKARKTRIMYQANLNFSQMEKYLSLLLESGLVECDGNSCYQLTSKGKEFLKIHAAYVERYTRMKKDVENAAKERLQLESVFFNNEKDGKPAADRNRLSGNNQSEG